MTLPGIEKRVNVTLHINDHDMFTASRFVSEKGYHVLAARSIAGGQTEIQAFFGATDIFDAFDRIEDDELREDVISVEIQGYLNTKKKVSGVA